MISIALSLLIWSLDIYPPYVKILQTGEPFESLPKIGFMIDLSFWTLAMISQAITRIYTKLKYPLLIDESSNELFSNHSLITCFVARFIPPIVTGLGIHVNVVQSSFICGKLFGAIHV